MRKQSFISIAIFLGAFLIGAIPVKASIATIGKTGEVVLNVLSAQDNGEGTSQMESLKVSKSSVEMGEADMPISLFRKDNKYLLNITGKNGEKSFDVTNYQDKILEIEERPSVKKISISLSGNQFVIEQAGIKARTYFQINVEPQNSKITILTPTGYKFLSMLPWDAVNILIRSKAITSLSSDKTVDISEDMNGNLFYTISGIKQIGIKDVYTYDAPVSAKISVVNGEILEVDQPIWLKLLGLFVVQT
jgi:hypothetical protein